MADGVDASSTPAKATAPRPEDTIKQVESTNETLNQATILRLLAIRLYDEVRRIKAVGIVDRSSSLGSFCSWRPFSVRCASNKKR